MKTSRLFKVAKKSDIPLELAIAAISQASVEEISQALENVPNYATAKIVMAIGNQWQKSV